MNENFAPRCWVEFTDPETKEPSAVRWTDVLDISVENTLYDAADSFELTLKNDKLLSDWLRKKQEVSIWYGYVKDVNNWDKNELAHVFTGQVDGVCPSFGMQMTVKLAGRDYSGPLLDNLFNLAFTERTASQIAEDLAKKNKLTPKVTPTTMIIERDLYRDKKEWKVLQMLAGREGYVCYVTKEKELVFRPRDDGQEKTVMKYLNYRQQEKSNLLGASFNDSMLEVINKVIVRHWDGANKRLIVAEEGDQNLIDKYGEQVRIIYDSKAVTQELAKAQAQKQLKELSRAVVTADSVRVAGDPALTAEGMVNIAGCGRFDGNYYIERVRHTYRKSEGYMCDLAVTSQFPDSAANYRDSMY